MQMSKHHPRYQAWLDKMAVTIRNEVDQEVMMATKLEALNKILLAMLGDARLLDMWWDGQNKAFNYATPREIYQEDPEKVIRYVMEHYR
jgi:hypothetical protein